MQLYCSKQKKSSLLNVKIDDFRRIIVFSDWISGAAELNHDFKFLGNCVNSKQEFYVIELAHFNHDKAIEISGGDAILKWFQYKQWLKINSSHMHLGYKTYTSKFLRILNLTPEY